MAITSYASASPTIGASEYSFAAASTSLPTKTDIGVYQLTADLNALAVGDQFLIQQYEMGVSGGTKRVVQEWPLNGAQGMPNYISPSFILGNGFDWTIKKLAGTDRAIPFTLWRIS